MYAMSLVKESLPDVFEPLQLGVGAPGGSERAIHMIQAGLETMGPDTILLKCDIRNAFNERKREQVLTELFKVDCLHPVWRLAHWAYKGPSDLLALDRGHLRRSIVSAQGVKQGDCFGSFLFSLSLHPYYLRCTNGVKGVDGCHC